MTLPRSFRPDQLTLQLAVLLTVLLLLVVVAAWYWVKRTPQPVPVVPAVAFTTPTPADDAAVSSVGEGITQRPLFWPSRRPVAPADVQEIPEVPEEPVRRGDDRFDQIQLVGTYGSGAVSGIIVSLDGERRRLGINESLVGWTLLGVDAAGAMFIPEGADMEDTPETRWIRLELVF